MVAPLEAGIQPRPRAAAPSSSLRASMTSSTRGLPSRPAAAPASMLRRALSSPLRPATSPGRSPGGGSPPRRRRSARRAAQSRESTRKREVLPSAEPTNTVRTTAKRSGRSVRSLAAICATIVLFPAPLLARSTTGLPPPCSSNTSSAEAAAGLSMVAVESPPARSSTAASPSTMEAGAAAPPPRPGIEGPAPILSFLGVCKST
mmetsp:Transcript_41548/g.132740  ORF Transcript_41548/g.132740 Transcript_41548/m.132740 type:complete len:204 (+) Transcript_41548:691-1302(+)